MTTTCFICKSNIKPGRHIYVCAKENNINLNSNELKLKQIEYKYNLIVDENKIKELYITNEWSLPDFRKNFGFLYGDTLFLLKYFNIPIRNISKSKRTLKAKEKYEETCLERYGVKNASSSPIIKEKRKDTFQEKYGVDNVRKSAWFKDWYKKFMFDTYGKGSLPNKYGGMNKWWDKQTDEYKKAHAVPMQKGYKKWYSGLTDEDKIAYNQKKANNLIQFSSSKLEEHVKLALTECGISFKHQFWINQKIYDFRILESTFILEINGDYWHANPLIYDNKDILVYPDRTITAEERWLEDFSKVENAKKYGYTVISLWETDILSNIDNLSVWLNNTLKDHVDKN